uniref:Harbinger transposase-derived protein n=1 Tax=Tanacetum cinerariifolium TaxID=118510 RepID=A0A6L2NTX0_TANCI|nr:harbinger transposase-derived protein [Tanacetum cinerariifolium]
MLEIANVDTHVLEVASKKDQNHLSGVFGPEFLRKPTITDVERLYAVHENKHGLPGMLESLDCTDWVWFGCPIAHKVQYCRHDHDPDPFILLEAVASQDLWIWHTFFGVANNDINITQRSPLLNDLKLDYKEAISPDWYPEEEHQPDDLIRSDEQRYRIVSNEVDELENGTCAHTSALRIRRGGASVRGNTVRKTCGSESVTNESSSNISNRLRSINRKVVRMRGKGDGSRACMYPGGRKHVGFGVSWDPVDGEAMLGPGQLESVFILTQH